jgi:hypothetical protein
MRHFHRSATLIAAISAIINDAYTVHAAKQHKIAALPEYYSRGKGGRKFARRPSGVPRARREARRLRASR